jgi:hypothetical protein
MTQPLSDSPSDITLCDWCGSEEVEEEGDVCFYCEEDDPADDDFSWDDDSDEDFI